MLQFLLCAILTSNVAGFSLLRKVSIPMAPKPVGRVIIDPYYEIDYDAINSMAPHGVKTQSGANQVVLDIANAVKILADVIAQTVGFRLWDISGTTASNSAQDDKKSLKLNGAPHDHKAVILQPHQAEPMTADYSPWVGALAYTVGSFLGFVGFLVVYYCCQYFCHTSNDGNKESHIR